MKNIFLKLFFCFVLVLILIFGFVYKNKFFNSSFFVFGQQNQQTLVVCPSGRAGQNGCDYIGGDGIQQAVDAAPVGSSSNKTTILIKAGNYTRQKFTQYIDSHNYKTKCFVNTKKKFLVFEGEEGVVLDGKGSANMSGFCAKEGKIEIKNLKIAGFKRDNYSCSQQNDLLCSRGYGIYLDGNIKALLENNQITGNQGNGIALYNSSQATIQNNQITGNQFLGIYLSDFSQAKIINNTLYENKIVGIYIYQCGDNNNPSVMAKNNIITRTKKTNGASGFGIGGDCLYDAGKLNNDSFTYNLIWENEGDHTSCGTNELCENFIGRINADPKFINPQEGDFHLKAESPAINSGDPNISDPDGSRSDMGVYGGPGACGFDPNLLGCSPTKTPTPSPTGSSPACPKKSEGDVNCDGKIDGVDYSMWLNRQCNSGCAAENLKADFNSDNKVNDDDYSIWFNHRQ
jgi:parallel beta-helix repeat protein